MASITQTRIIRDIEKMYMTEYTPNIYLALEDLDFKWDLKDVLRFDQLWNEGISIYEIAYILNRDPDEVLLLALDRLRKGKVSERENGLFGTRRRHEVRSDGEKMSL